MFGSWIVVVKTVKNFLQTGLYQSKYLCEHWQLFFTFTSENNINIRSANPAKFAMNSFSGEQNNCNQARSK